MPIELRQVPDQGQRHGHRVNRDLLGGGVGDVAHPHAGGGRRVEIDVVEPDGAGRHDAEIGQARDRRSRDDRVAGQHRRGAAGRADHLLVAARKGAVDVEPGGLEDRGRPVQVDSLHHIEIHGAAGAGLGQSTNTASGMKQPTIQLGESTTSVILRSPASEHSM